MATPTGSREESLRRLKDLDEFCALAGLQPQWQYPDENYKIEEAVLACREYGIRVPERLRAAVVSAFTDYFEVSHEDDDDFYLDALDPWDAWQKFLAAPALPED